MRSIEAEARSPEEAIAKALADLQVDRSQVLIEVLDEGSRGFLGVGGKPARVRVTPRGENEDGSAEVVRTLLELMDIRFQLEVRQEGESTDIRIDAPEDEGLLIGRRGQTLDAIRHVAQRIVAAKVGREAIVNIDVGDYRARREDALRQRGLDAAEEALSKGRSITLDPMSAQDRRVIHMALADREDLHTYTVGNGARRRVVVAPGSKDEHGAPREDEIESSREREPAYVNAYEAVPDPGFKPARVVSRGRKEAEAPAPAPAPAEGARRTQEGDRRPRTRSGEGSGAGRRDGGRGRPAREERAPRGERPARGEQAPRAEQRRDAAPRRPQESRQDPATAENRSQETPPDREHGGDRESRGEREGRGDSRSRGSRESHGDREPRTRWEPRPDRRDTRGFDSHEPDNESEPGATELSEAPVVDDSAAEKPFSSTLARQILQLGQDKPAPGSRRKTRRR